jgi:2-polyprenyl-3-methyl-5-hydroxy-6-metoxy-1,4-benzoquinol methylase
MSTCHVCGSRLKPLFQQRGYDFWACTACGLECLFPQPDDRALANIYRESYYDAWGLKESQASVKHLKQGSFSQYLQILGEVPLGMRLLDCGAATGFLAELARAKGLDAYAIELSSFGAEACRALLGADHVYEGEVERAWFSANPENRFDIITMIDFIEHVRHPRAVLQWAATRLKPRGSLLLVTPCVGSLSHRLMGQRWTHYKIEHLWYFTPRSLTALLSEVGFSLATLQPGYKRLSLDYAIHQFRVYPHPVISPVLSVLDRLLPRATKSWYFALPLGEMLVHAVVKLPSASSH